MTVENNLDGSHVGPIRVNQLVDWQKHTDPTVYTPRSPLLPERAVPFAMIDTTRGIGPKGVMVTSGSGNGRSG